MTNEQARLRLLQLLQQHPELSQRELAARLGVSLGRTHYLLRSLIDKGVLKVENFLRSDRKLGYLYQLTPAGIEAKLHLTRTYLQRKEAEYHALRQEIAQLRAELDPVPAPRDSAP